MTEPRRLTQEEMTALYLEESQRSADWAARVGGPRPHPSGGLVNPFADDVPHGWIQWKGTEVCMDIRCACGCLHHIDADFAYVIRTPCGRLYSTGAHIPLFEINEADAGGSIVRDCADETRDEEGCTCKNG